MEKAKFGRIFAVLACLGAIALALVALGLIPAKRPDAPQRTRLEISRTEQPPPAVTAVPAKPSEPLRPPEVWSLPICELPEQGARVQRLAWGAAEQIYVIWCKGGYVSVQLRLEGGAPVATRLARFPARVELPGGVASGDFDGDGAFDLMLGTAPTARTFHRPGAGTFWLRGRAQGGFEPAQAIMEAPVTALSGLEFDGKPGTDLALLTRGDLTAQRPGELWLFAGGSSLTRAAVIPLGLAPRDLVALTPSPDAPVLWAVLAQPGSLIRVPVAGALQSKTPVKQVVALPGVQGVMADTRGTAVFARDSGNLWRIPDADEPRVAEWAKGVNVGPSVVGDLDGDARADVLSVIEHGVASLAGEPPETRELELAGRVFDVSTYLDGSAAERGLALMTAPESTQLALVLLPPQPWSFTGELAVRPGEVVDLPGMASVVLE